MEKRDQTLRIRERADQRVAAKVQCRPRNVR